MVPLITDNMYAIPERGRAFRIVRLELIGSAATGDFDRQTSDVDVIVDLGSSENLSSIHTLG